MQQNHLKWHRLTLLSYALLIITLFSWYFVISPPAHTLSWILSSAFLLLLLLPAYGLVTQSPRVYMWSSYLMLIYFSHGIIESWANDEHRVYALAELLLSSLYFISATMCVRYVRKPKTE